MRNKILRSANAKYHYSYLLIFYKINKGDLPLMYSCFLVGSQQFSRFFVAVIG